jgi:hypothetical protein
MSPSRLQHLLSPAVAALTATEAAAAAAPEKKKRKGFPLKADAAGAMWALRLEVVGALHKCFLFDTAVERFVDTERFEQVSARRCSRLRSIPYTEGVYTYAPKACASLPHAVVLTHLFSNSAQLSSF